MKVDLLKLIHCISFKKQAFKEKNMSKSKQFTRKAFGKIPVRFFCHRFFCHRFIK